MNKTDKQAEIREKVLPACTPAHTYAQTTGEICRFFLFAWLSLHLYPFIPPPTGSLILLRSLSSPSVCPLPPLPVFMLSFPSLAHLSSILCLGAIAANQTVYPSLISTLPHGGSCPLKTMKVGLSTEPGIQFNYINKELGLTKKKKRKKKMHYKKIHYGNTFCYTFMKSLLMLLL